SCLSAVPGNLLVTDPPLARPKLGSRQVFVRYGQQNVQPDFERPVRHVEMPVGQNLPVKLNPARHASPPLLKRDFVLIIVFLGLATVTRLYVLRPIEESNV